MRLDPVLAGLRDVPVRAPRAGAPAPAGGRRRPDRLRDGRAARGDARVHPRGARRGRDRAALHLPVGRGAARAARRGRRRGSSGASARRWTRTPRSSPRWAPRRRSSTWRRCSRATSSPCPRPPTRSTSAARCSPARRCSSCRCARRPASSPTSTRCPAETWARVAILWLNYPNNPTAATAPLAFYERAAALAREHGFVLACDEAYSEIYFGEPPASALQLGDLHRRRGVQHALQALLDARLPVGLRGRRPGADRRAQALPAERRRRAARVRPARRGRGVGRRGARRGGARPLPRQARPARPGARRARAAPRGRRRLVLPLARRRAGRRRARRAHARGGHPRRARAPTSARRAPATCGSRSSRRRRRASARPSGSTRCCGDAGDRGSARALARNASPRGESR